MIETKLHKISCYFRVALVCKLNENLSWKSY